MEIFKLFILFFMVFNFSYILHMVIEIWQNTPLKEEKSTPIYITKEIQEDL
jgi:hypothetical protein